MAFTINNYAPSTQIDNHDGGIININNGNVQNENNSFFPTAFTQDKGVQLCDFLIDGGFIAEDTDRDSFLYIFGCKQTMPHSLKPIQWLKNLEFLRETLEQAYKPLITSKSITKAGIEKVVPKCFINKDRKEITLPKHKEYPSFEIDHIRTYFSKFWE